MRYQKNGQSKLHNLALMINNMEENDRIQFADFATEGNKGHPKYLDLFTAIAALLDEGVEATSLKREQIEQKFGETGSSKDIKNLIDSLYDQVLSFFGSLYQNNEEPDWVKDVDEGLYAVQELIRRGLKDQAAVYLVQLEAKVGEYADKIWECYPVLVKLSALKIQVGRKDFLKRLERDDFLYEVHRMTVSPSRNRLIKYGLDSSFSKTKTKMFYMTLLFQSEKTDGNWTTEKTVIKELLKTIPQRAQGNSTSSTNQRRWKRTGGQIMEQCAWNLLGYQRALVHGFYDDASGFLGAMQQKVEQINRPEVLGMILTTWIAGMRSDIDLISTFVKGMSADEKHVSIHEEITFGDYKLLYADADLKNLPLRIELNRILLGLWMKHPINPAADLKVIEDIPALPKAFRYEIRLLKLLVNIESDREDLYEQIGTDYKFFKRQPLREAIFEKAATSLLFTLKSSPRSGWAHIIQEKHEATYLSLEAVCSKHNPVHAFFIAWILKGPDH